MNTDKHRLKKFIVLTKKYVVGWVSVFISANQWLI
jgi:hypothetical protein